MRAEAEAAWGAAAKAEAARQAEAARKAEAEVEMEKARKAAADAEAATLGNVLWGLIRFVCNTVGSCITFLFYLLTIIFYCVYYILYYILYCVYVCVSFVFHHFFLFLGLLCFGALCAKVGKV
jgi:hypothetical protein